MVPINNKDILISLKLLLFDYFTDGIMFVYL